MPLTLAYAMTVHGAQGSTVGRTPPGRPRNMLQRIIASPGKRGFEGNNPGLFYTILSRITTMGDLNDKMSSAIYFTGTDMSPDRIRNITVNATGKQQYEKVQKRAKWVKYLEKNIIKLRTEEKDEIEDVLQWADSYRSNQETLLKLILGEAK